MSMRSKCVSSLPRGRLPAIPRERLQIANYLVAYLAATLDPWAARSRSNTVRQPVESWVRCFTMHAVIAGMFGMSELHRRNASLVHICCASALNAKLEVDASADEEPAKASTKAAWQIVLVRDAVIFGSSVSASPRRALLMPMSAATAGFGL